MDVNLVAISGRLANDPRLQYLTNGTPWATFSILTIDAGPDDNQYKTYVACSAWGKLAERIGELNEGHELAVTGRINWRRIETGDDSTPNGKLEVRVSSVNAAPVSMTT